MRRARLTPFATLLSFAFLTACTAMEQKDAFLDSLPRPVENVIFRDDFDNGLAQWNQTSGTWLTSTPAMNGLALQAPSSATAATFNISTAATLDLTGKTGCVLEYDTQFLLKGEVGVSANVQFGSTVVGTFKDTSGASDISSATSFVRRKALLPANGTGRISFVSSVTNNTTGFADWRIDNVVVRCNDKASTSTTVLDDNFNVSAANWSLNSLWTFNATAGFGGTGGLVTIGGGGNAYTGTSNATYVPSISLSGRFGCELQMFYNHSNSAAENCLAINWNSNRIWAHCGTGTAGTLRLLLTANEDTTANTLQFRCIDANGALGGNNTCTVDQLTLTCQQ
ncbi:hypothetical protein Turpa_0873 [Turneriella parva DSM 21527]|uniref:Lipoprotein n=2 Tax=Turneriella TaxID=338321 RepID=I4B2L7_TURPD|nr:hypothetical protein Turpa_0873 [Turneriella parva DSM 21527]